MSASERVIEAVADRKGVDPLELEVPLYDAVDPDALDLLVQNSEGRPERSSVRIEFTYDGVDVAVAADGSVDVNEPS